MKTTIEVKGYQIVIEETENEISVTATKDDETMEEFTLNLGEESEGLGKEDDDNVKSFDEFGDEEEDFDENPNKKEEINDDDDQDDDNQEDDEDEDEDDEENGEPMALESFQSFINRRRK